MTTPGTPPRPFTRAQALQNAAFLRELERTGNDRLAAEAAGVAMGTLLHRRRTRPVFATAWAAAKAVAQARLDPVRGTVTGEGRLVRLRSGRVQLRRHQASRLPPERWQAFLAALSATANVALSAAAAGMAMATVYHRRRNNPGFAREMRLALEMGYDRLEEALLAGFAPESYADDGWRHNEPPAIPAMTAAQALHLLTLHQKEARLGGTPDALRHRRGEPWQAEQMRMMLMHEHHAERAREQFRIAEAARLARGEAPWLWLPPDEPVLPALDQVTGWSKAKGKRAGRVRGLFGGWQDEGDE